jgi:glycosyltransferase involved in cell wall biosynthesis
MNLTVFTDGHFRRRADGTPCSMDGVNGHRRWAGYLGAFDSVTVVGRLSDGAGDAAAPVTGPGVRFFAVPGYSGVTGYLRHARAVNASVAEACRLEGAFWLRCPGNLSRMAWKHLRRNGTPYGVEVAGDPYDVFAPGVFRHPLRPVLRSFLTNSMREQVRGAAVAHYVTEQYLQARYPTNGVFAGVSDVDLGPEAFVSQQRSYSPAGARKLVFVGTLNVLYKGLDTLLHALTLAVNRGLDLRLTVVGDGLHRPSLERLARRLGLEQRVSFLGHVRAGAGVREVLDGADLFVHPSRVDALPRALVEAMARGLPCIASNVGGIPELLDASVLVEPGDAPKLASAICWMVASPDDLMRASRSNLSRAGDYRADVLGPRRKAVYERLRLEVTRRQVLRR